MKLKEYQISAINNLLIRSNELLRRREEQIMIFKAPTGSGKTIMMAEYLKQLTATFESHLCVIWIAPRTLHKQSYQQLCKYYKNSQAFKCSYFSDLTDNQIGKNEILFINWASINKQNKNTIIRENEQEIYLSKVLENTEATGRFVLLVIDESHDSAKSDNAYQLIKDIKPKLTIEVSATPILQNVEDIVPVKHEDVKDEGMIKQSVVLNAGFVYPNTNKNDLATFIDNTDELVLDQAILQREKLAAAFDVESSIVNPLLCIQLPNKVANLREDMKEWVIAHLENEHGICVANGKLAIWLSDDYVNKENLSTIDNETEVLLFKQAIAVGWDCPRAHILLMFRDMKSEIFSVQTIGRIMRMPDPAHGAYNNDILNRGYVYTNLPNIHVKQTIADNYVQRFSSQRINAYTPLQLRSVHSKRLREKTRIAAIFRKLFIQVADEHKLADKINHADQTVESSFITEYESSNIDNLIREETMIHGRKINVTDATDVQKLFDYFILQNLFPYYPEQHSFSMVKDAIYQFFGGPLVIAVNKYDESDIARIVLSKSNRERFIEVLTSAKERYKEQTTHRKEPLQVTNSWEVSEQITYNANYDLTQVDKSVMLPFYAPNNQSSPEQKFIAFLENNANVEWWYKNGERESMYFAVPYNENNEDKPFYVDFIVRFVDGRIGLFDPKDGATITEAPNKSDGLLEYIKDANKHRDNNKSLIGGIVTQLDAHGAWKIYSGKGCDLNKANLTNWDWLMSYLDSK